MDYNEYKCTKCGHKFYGHQAVCPNCHVNLHYESQKRSSFGGKFKLNWGMLGLSGIIIGVMILLISSYFSNIGYPGYYSILGLFLGGFIPGLMAKEFYNSMITYFVFGIINLFFYPFDNLIIAIITLLVTSVIFGLITGYLGKIVGEKLMSKQT